MDLSPIGSEEAKIYHRGLRWLPVVGLLLYRKHVITGQPYIPQLIRAFEADRVPPTPSAQAMRAWLEGPGRLQLGSAVAPQVDRVWLRPICNGR